MLEHLEQALADPRMRPQPLCRDTLAALEYPQYAVIWTRADR